MGACTSRQHRMTEYVIAEHMKVKLQHGSHLYFDTTFYLELKMIFDQKTILDIQVPGPLKPKLKKYLFSKQFMTDIKYDIIYPHEHVMMKRVWLNLPLDIYFNWSINKITKITDRSVTLVLSVDPVTVCYVSDVVGYIASCITWYTLHGHIPVNDDIDTDIKLDIHTLYFRLLTFSKKEK